MRWRLCYAKTDRTGGPFEADSPQALQDALLAHWDGAQAGLEAHSPVDDDWLAVAVLPAGDALTPERCGHLLRVGAAMVEKRRAAIAALR